MKKKIEDAIDKVSRLGTNPDEFKIWLKSFLITKIGDPLPGYSLTEYPHEYLYRIYESTKNVIFQERLRCAVKELFKDWNINARKTDSIEYYSSLLNLIAELPVSEMYPDLIEIALTGFYCGTESENEKLDVQTLILQVIAGFPPPGMKKLKDRLMDLAEKYILDMRYTPLCFRIAWQIRYENAIQYIRPLLECSQIRQFDIYGTIERFILGCRVGKFKNLLMPMLLELQSDDMRKYFLEILFKLGVEIHVPNFPPDPKYLLLEWDIYDQLISTEKVLCENQDIMTLIEKLGTRSIDVQEDDNKFMVFLSMTFGTITKSALLE
ncbi:MAG: hypothetical protein NT166_08010 [Candidatus Aminicenantes bacterium]|nr:hypothetical protein [Candidatus Aminicenantes bacterium]